ncbi:sulfotransferase family protein [Allosphingosinicella sp.]|uniref:sulfotransferase family protein n=1 Tax=Allosphingosinicella sp. TaxID=2823234 RepID=UPI003D729DCF
MPSSCPALPRPVPLRLANCLLGSVWHANLSSPPDLDDETLERQAARQTGLGDFGDPWFRRPLRRLLRSLNEEARLNPVGRVVTRTYVLKLLRERLWAQQWFDENPAIRRRSIARPVVVVGPMRSGTTRLHRLLAADERFAHLRMFETMCPVPRPTRVNGHDRRPWVAALSLGLLHRANPATAIVHPTGPMAPEEELGLLVASAWGMKHEAQWRVPAYARWCEEQDATPAYAHMADLLRLTGWLRGEDPAKPWLLKTPQHMLDLPALLRVFPDARIIFTHRDPAAVVGSSCSLAWNQMCLQSDYVDPRWIGREWLRKTELKISRMSGARQGLPAGRMIDVHFDEMDRDWHAVMRRIYRFLDLDIVPAEAGMAAYMTRSERDRRFRSHSYRLASFGLDAGDIRESFGDYLSNFAVAGERLGRGETGERGWGSRVAIAAGG